MIKEFKKFIRKGVYHFIPPPYIQQSFSQAGEDLVLNFLFNDYGKKNISYLDIGTNNPDWGNNTYLFYKKGCRGVCVEADSSLISQIQEIRKGDTVINAGVSVSDQKEADFYIFNVPAINTFDKEEAELRLKSGNYKIERVVKVPLVNINDLIINNFQTYPDLLSIDIEGLDLAVLQSLSYHLYPIPVICVETCKYSENHIRPKDHCFGHFMESIGYEVYADTYINTIFVNKNWFYNKK